MRQQQASLITPSTLVSFALQVERRRAKGESQVPISNMFSHMTCPIIEDGKLKATVGEDTVVHFLRHELWLGEKERE